LPAINCFVGIEKKGLLLLVPAAQQTLSRGEWSEAFIARLSTETKYMLIFSLFIFIFIFSSLRFWGRVSKLVYSYFVCNSMNRIVADSLFAPLPTSVRGSYRFVFEGLSQDESFNLLRPTECHQFYPDLLNGESLYVYNCARQSFLAMSTEYFTIHTVFVCEILI
jgi:hypothetical protein